MSWISIYLSDHRSGGPDFDILAPAICAKPKLIAELKSLVSEYEKNTDSCPKTFFRLLILSVLEYLRERVWDSSFIANMLAAKDFLVACTNLKENIDNQKIRSNAKYLLLNLEKDGSLFEETIQQITELIFKT